MLCHLVEILQLQRLEASCLDHSGLLEMANRVTLSNVAGLCVCVTQCLSFKCVCVCLSLCLSVYLSVCLSICLSVCPWNVIELEAIQQMFKTIA